MLLNTIVTSTKPHSVTWITRHFQHPILKSFQKLVKTKNLLCIGFIRVSSDFISTTFFSLIEYSKRQKIKMGNLLCHTVTQVGFHPYHFENIFYSVKKGQAKVEIIIPNPIVFQSSPLLPLSIQRKIDAISIIVIYFSLSTQRLDWNITGLGIIISTLACPFSAFMP